MSTETAERRVRAVMAALARVVGEPELADARAQLPPEYGRAFETGGLLAEEPFADAVADATDLDDEEAEVAAAATLKTLGERLSRGEAEDVAHYLQADAATWLTAAATEEPAAFDADVFLARVADRADVAEGVAAEYADAVSDALAGVVPNRELSRMAEQLPDEYERVLAPAVSR